MCSAAGPEADGWRAGRFGTGAPVTEIPIPYDGAGRLAWWQAKKEGERVRAMQDAGLEGGDLPLAALALLW